MKEKPKELICPKCDAHYSEGFKHYCPKWMLALKKRFNPKKNVR